MKRRHIEQGIIDQCSQIYFRQSMLKDYLQCPQMCLYKHILNIEEVDTYFAALLGTAGHKVIYIIHRDKTFDLSYFQVYQRLEEAFNEALNEQSSLPLISKNFDSIQDQLTSKLPTYASLVYEYMQDDRNQSFHSTMHEQYFVLPVPDSKNPDHPFLFSGQIDQAGYTDDGTFLLRDLKFRDSALRPTKIELDLDIQLTVYATALRHGKPACSKCRPRYEQDFVTQEQRLVYTGPCAYCRVKIGTPAWPQQQPDFCELVWMMDYQKYERDQYSQFNGIDKSLPKIKNHATGRLVYQKRENPNWYEGYKKGDYKGPVFLRTQRSVTACEIYFSDILVVCESLRSGIFHRNPGSHCHLWCRHKEPCLQGLELQMEEADLAGAAEYSSDDF